MLSVLSEIDQSAADVVAENCPMCGGTKLRTLHECTSAGRSWAMAQCESCSLSFTSPTPTEDDLNSFYEGDYHAPLRIPGGTEKAFEEKYRRYADAVARHLSGGRVVDVGCSTGLLVKTLKDRGYEAEGIELNSRSAEWGRTHYGVTIHTDPLEQCGFIPESFDALLLTDVLEHTQHPRDFLCDAGRLIKPDGYAFVTFPDISSLESRYWYMLSKLLRRNWLWTNCHIPLHVWEFTKMTAEQCFQSAGFQVVEFRRHQSPAEENESKLIMKLLSLPVRPLLWPLFGRWLGTQMEFVIQKR